MSTDNAALRLPRLGRSGRARGFTGVAVAGCIRMYLQSTKEHQ